MSLYQMYLTILLVLFTCEWRKVAHQCTVSELFRYFPITTVEKFMSLTWHHYYIVQNLTREWLWDNLHPSAVEDNIIRKAVLLKELSS